MMIKPQIMKIDTILRQGIEFTGEICYSGVSGEELYTKPIEEGGTAVTGLIYEKYKNGNIAYYSYYANGIADGECVSFFENGALENYKQMKKAVISGYSISWFENGNLKSVGVYKYGFAVTYKLWNREGALLEEKLKPSEFEQLMIDKYDK